jgi:hypothetical protein
MKCFNSKVTVNRTSTAEPYRSLVHRGGYRTVRKSWYRRSGSECEEKDIGDKDFVTDPDCVTRNS